MDARPDHDGQAPEEPETGPKAASSKPQDRGRSAWRVLSALPATLTLARKVVVDLTAVVVAFVVIVFFVSTMMDDDTIVVEAPSVPKLVSDRGLTSELLTQLLLAQIQQIQDGARSSKSPEAAGPKVETLTINAAGLDFSLDSLALMVRRILGLEGTRSLKMSVVCTTPDCSDDVLILHVVSQSNGALASTAAPLDLSDLTPSIDVASAHLLLSFDPYLLGMFHLRAQDHEVARNIAKQMILERHPQRIWAYNILGNIETRHGDLDVAREYFDRALEMDRGFVPAIVNIGSIYARKNRIEEAIEHYKTALSADPDNAFAYANLGRVLLRRCNWVEATEAYERAFEADPGISSVLNGLALVKDVYEDDQAAAKLLRQLAPASNAPETRSVLNFEDVLESTTYCQSSDAKLR